MTVNFDLIAIQKMPAIQNRAVAQQTFFTLASLKQLYLATNLLYSQMNVMLMANCFLVVILMLTSSYYAISYFFEGNFMGGCWDATDVIDSFIRFWLMCHIADTVRSAVSDKLNATLKVMH